MSIPVKFKIGERIAQIIFHRVEKEVECRESKYHEGDMEAKPDKAQKINSLKDGSLIDKKLCEI